MESVAAERLNKLGKNPNIISNRQDLKIDQEALKDIVAKATPNPSRSSSENELHRRPSKANVKDSSDDDHCTGGSVKTKSSTPPKSRIKLLKKPNLHVPNILRKSPSSPSKLSRKLSQTPEPSVWRKNGFFFTLLILKHAI